MRHEASRISDKTIDYDTLFQELIHSAEEGFAKHFRRPPRWITAAPGRVNLIGEHTDYNKGFVLPMAIEHYVVLAADYNRETDGKPTICVHSMALGETKKIPLDEIKIVRSVDWTDYIRGVFAGFIRLDVEPKPLDILVEGNVPVGAGLSSSAALEVSTATLIEAVSGSTLDPLEKILLCQKAEHEYAGVPCGIMDQFCVVKGRKDHSILLDCKSMEFTMIPFYNSETAVLITHSKIDHKLSASKYTKRRLQCEEAAKVLEVESLREATLDRLEAVCKDRNSDFYKRVCHVITENERTITAANALQTGNWEGLGLLMTQSHISLRDDYQVSCPELDLLVDIANKQEGVFGSRMTGGGFGGCMVSLVRAGAIWEIIERIGTSYREKTGLEPDFYITRSAQGSSLVKD